MELEPQDLPQSINALAQDNPLDFFQLQDRGTPLDLLREQMKDPNIREAITWISQRKNPDTLYSNWELKKYHKQLPRLELVKGILYRKFFDNTGKNFVRQYVVPKRLREEFYIVFIIVNSEDILE